MILESRIHTALYDLLKYSMNRHDIEHTRARCMKQESSTAISFSNSCYDTGNLLTVLLTQRWPSAVEIIITLTVIRLTHTNYRVQ